MNVVAVRLSSFKSKGVLLLFYKVAMVKSGQALPGS